MRSAATILHADLDAFYAAVEIRDNPRLRERPLAVGGGVVLSASYEARSRGVRTPMTGREARRLCPDLIVVPPRFEAYVDASRRVMVVLEAFTPLVQPISIDEAFLDVAGSTRLFGDPVTIAKSLRKRVAKEVGLPISVGVATTKHLAKVASRVAKPDGLVVVDAGDERAFLGPLPVSYLWGVGPVTAERLARYGIHTIGELASFPSHALRSTLGEHWGAHLWQLAQNYDPRPVETRRRPGSVGAQSAGDATDVERRHRTLLALSERVGTRLRRKGRGGRRITVRVRFADMTAATRSSVLPGPIAETTALYRLSAALVDALIAERAAGRPITLVGISVSHLEEMPHLQLELPMFDPGALVRPGSAAHVRLRDLDQAVDAVRDRFGRDVVSRAATRAGPQPEVRPPADSLEVASEGEP